MKPSRVFPKEMWYRQCFYLFPGEHHPPRPRRGLPPPPTTLGGRVRPRTFWPLHHKIPPPHWHLPLQPAALAGEEDAGALSRHDSHNLQGLFLRARQGCSSQPGPRSAAGLFPVRQQAPHEAEILDRQRKKAVFPPPAFLPPAALPQPPSCRLWQCQCEFTKQKFTIDSEKQRFCDCPSIKDPIRDATTKKTTFARQAPFHRVLNERLLRSFKCREEKEEKEPTILFQMGNQRRRCAKRQKESLFTSCP